MAHPERGNDPRRTRGPSRRDCCGEIANMAIEPPGLALTLTVHWQSPRDQARATAYRRLAQGFMVPSRGAGQVVGGFCYPESVDTSGSSTLPGQRPTSATKIRRAPGFGAIHETATWLRGHHAEPVNHSCQGTGACSTTMASAVSTIDFPIMDSMPS